MLANPWMIVADAGQVTATWAGAIGAVAAVIAVALTITSGNRQRQRDYDAEIAKAEQRGRDSRNEEVARIRADCEERVARVRDDLVESRKETANWRAIALGRGRNDYPPA